ncbi:MAG: hypothetical protein ABR910_07845 [Acidobacteriaceae bacterium]|jgi:hypothetical protein
MSTVASPPNLAESKVGNYARGAAIPWYIWVGVAAVTSSTLGGVWDVSWHRSIGRDSFWTPAHMLIYLCAVLAGIVGLFLVTQCTLGRDPQLRDASVSILGLRAPLGVFLAGWGGLAMLTSAPFDNWWHNAYGLDVQIVSPPHTVLILGIRAVAVGMIFLILAAMNRAAGSGDTTLFHRLQLLFLYLGGLAIHGQMFFLQEFTWDVVLHQASAYIAMGIGLPMLFALFWQASRFPWTASATAAIYTLMGIAETLILPLVPAQPKLGPVFNPITHLIPAKFPILILIPALAFDFLWQRTLTPEANQKSSQDRKHTWKLWQVGLISGFLFTAVLVAVEWPFAKFLLSKASENRFFGTIYFDYNARPNGPDRSRLFFFPDSGLRLWFGLLRASLYASLSAWLGLLFGRWMRGVQR